MRFDRKTIITIFVLFLFGGTIIIQAMNLFLGQKMPPELSEAVVMETSLGIIEIKLDFSNAPITAANFKKYVEEGFYDGTIFHRVIEGFMIQGGGFDKDALPKTTRDPIVLESNNGLKNERGTIAMARTSEPDSATSQFFINTVDNSFLNYAPDNPGYAVFGKVVSGLEVVDAIEKVETETRGFYQDWPKEEVVIIRVYLKEE
jgi:cyclophilin family peptidyl-prolyl cis-trans isomerase